MMAKKKAAPRSAHGTGICQAIYDMLRQGRDNATILAAVLKKFPQSHLKSGGVSWCRNKLRTNGEKIKTNRELTEAKPVKRVAKKDPLAA